MGLIDDAGTIESELIELRHALHRAPEIGLHLPHTQARVLDALDGLAIELKAGDQLSSVVGVLRGGEPGPTVLLRGDMDALPVLEASDVAFRSRLDGTMHACGHDMHTAMLIGAAHLLSARSESLRGSVVFMFQPGEEGFDGAGKMLDEGVLEASGSHSCSCVRVACTSKRGQARHVRIPTGIDYGRMRSLFCHSERTRRARISSSQCQGSNPRSLRDGDDPSYVLNAQCQCIRSRGYHRRADSRRQ